MIVFGLGLVVSSCAYRVPILRDPQGIVKGVGGGPVRSVPVSKVAVRWLRRASWLLIWVSWVNSLITCVGWITFVHWD